MTYFCFKDKTTQVIFHDVKCHTGAFPLSESGALLKGQKRMHWESST